MRQLLIVCGVLLCLWCCSKNKPDADDDNPYIKLPIPDYFPDFNTYVVANRPTKYGVILGERLFNDKRFSVDNSISCASCHKPENAFADNNTKAIGVYGRVGLRNVPPIQNMAFMKFYNWDGSILQLEKQPLIPIITKEEMNSSIVEVINKIQNDTDYQHLFRKTYGDTSVTPDRIYKSIAQYLYTLISANSKYDKVMRNEAMFTAIEARGYHVFQQKCESCHSTVLFTDQSFRNVGFPINPNENETGRARVTKDMKDFMSFRVPSLRNVEYTAPYGSFGQFPTLRSVLDYFDGGVLDAENLDPFLKNNNRRIPLTEQEKEELIAFLKTLSDPEFITKTQ